MERKFELMKDEFVTIEGKKLYRIIAIKDFGKVKAGALGGYVESESNLSQEDNCWIDDEAKVFNGARVEGNATLIEEASVSGDVVVTEDVFIEGDAVVNNTTGKCITLGGRLHLAAGALIESPDNFVTIMTHDGTISLFKNDNNGIDICLYHGEEFIHTDVAEFFNKYSEKGMLSFSAILVLGAICNIDQCMKAKASQTLNN